MNLITCKNFENELVNSLEGKNFNIYYHDPVCLDNSMRSRDVIQEILDEKNLESSHPFICDNCNKTYKRKSKHNGEVISHRFCFDKVLSPTLVEYYMANGYYLVTPGWVNNWEQYVKNIWGFNERSARQFFKELNTKILLLDTLTDSKAKNNLIQFCNFIGREYEVLPVGLDYFKLQVKKITDKYIQDKEINRKKQEFQEAQSKLINFSLSLDLIKNISNITDMNELVEKIFNVLRMMFMPEVLKFIPVEEIEVERSSEFKTIIKELLSMFKSKPNEVVWTESESGFASSISFNRELLGILVIDKIYFKEYKKLYYNSFLQIKDIFGISLYNAKLFDGITTAKDETERQKIYFQQLFSNSPEMILITDNVFQVSDINASLRNFLNVSFDSLVDKQLLDVFENVLKVDSQINSFLYSKDILLEVNALVNNQEKVLEILKYEITQNNKVIGYYIIFADITERILTAKRMRRLAFHDTLTGLYNRAFCEEEMARQSKKRNPNLGVIIGDVNGLKITNDAFGHGVGDQLLVDVSNILKSSCRDGDVIARWGGDEFVILLPNITENNLIEVIHRIQEKCNQYESEKVVHLSISLGYALFTSHVKTLSQAFIAAENMMYEDKLLQRDSVRSKIVQSLETSLFEKSYETEEHALRVAEICTKIGHALGLSDSKMGDLKLLGRLHDIGKIVIDDTILSKPGILTFEEMKIIKSHPETGFRIASSIPELSHIAEFILYHHERWDGTGYPTGLKGENIPLEARILAIADSIDAMRSKRPYKEQFSNEKVIMELKSCSGTQFDPELIKIYLQIDNNKT